MNSEWTTFQGKIVSYNTIDHQHLSNTIWYWKILHDLDVSDAVKVLSDRFNGQLLPYRPHVDFEYEIDMLRDKGFLHSTFSPRVTNIIYKGHVIGEIRTFPTELFK